MAAYLDIEIEQGATFKKRLQVLTPTIKFCTITNASQTAPCVLTTAAPHPLQSGWNIDIESVNGMVEINTTHRKSATTRQYKITRIDDTHLSLDGINATTYQQYTSGGVIQYAEPLDLTGQNGRMKIRDAQGNLIYDASSGISIDAATRYIDINIDAATTASFSFDEALYDLEIEKAGEVLRIINGKMTLSHEQTK